LEFSLKWKGPILGVVETRRHYTNYFKHIPNFKEYRMRLVTANQADELFEILNEIEHMFGDYQFS
jgi:tRNA-dihydrouridine synthase